MSDTPKRILLGHLASNGDCLYATTVARQIKADYPGCHLTWAIGSSYRSVIELNPDVDAEWVIPNYTNPNDPEAWFGFVAEALERQKRGEFDAVFFTQIAPGNLQNLAGSTRTSVFRGYPRPITVDKTPVLRLSPAEVEHVRQFALEHHLAAKKQVVLFECSPRSEQSRVNLQFALDVATKLTAARDDVAFILSTNHSFEPPNPNITAGNALSLRENAELTKYCTLLVGASSGISWITTSDWAKPLPMLQLIVPDVARGNSFIYDYEERGQDTSGIIEMSSYTLDEVCACLNTIFEGDFAAARTKFLQKTPLGYQRYTDLLKFFLFNRHFGKAWTIFKLHVREYGPRPQFFLIPIFIPLRWIATRPLKLLAKLARRG